MSDAEPEVVYQLWCINPLHPDLDERQLGEFDEPLDAQHVIGSVSGPNDTRDQSDFEIRPVEQ